MTDLLDTSDDGIARGAALLAAGELVAFPTETVYGLGADACNDRAVAAIFAAKGRPRFNPLIVHCASADAAADIAEFDEDAARLADAFWPGPLTLVLPLRPAAGVSRLVTAGLDSLAVRVPAHPVARRLLAAFGGPVAAPSANPSGKLSPTRASDVLAGLANRIAAVIDGGPCEVGMESTIVAPGRVARLLRPGGLPIEALEDCLGRPLVRNETPGDRPEAPGQLVSHYAPTAAVRLNATDVRPGERFLGFGEVSFGPANLSPSGDLVEAAANLFRMLHELDAGGPQTIAVAPIPTHGLGLAINDRLERAAAPRG